MGPVAEDEVLKCLASKDTQIRAEACRILQDIGTSKSLVELVPLSVDRNFFLASPAKMAVQGIKSRQNR